MLLPSFGTDGVRGVALTELTVDYVESLGAAVARVLGAGTWLIGRDTRESGPALQAALMRGLRSEGALVVVCGEVPTPALALFSSTHGAPAAMITASHNPYTDNGVKIFAAGGSKLRDEAEERIERELEMIVASRSADPHASDADVAPSPGGQPSPPDPGVTEVDSAVRTYVDHLVSLFPADALAGLRVVLDCANGAMSIAAPAAVRALGASVRVIHAAPDGTNINASCGATDPSSLAADVVSEHADAGLAFDGDGDRVIAIDGVGNVVDGDRMIALAAVQLQGEGRLTDDTVVVTVMSNLGFHRAMRAAGIHVVATAVGDRYVLEALDEGGYALGGEQSGHVIYRQLASTGDGLLAGLRLLQHVRQTGRPLADLAADVMTTLPQVLLNVAVRERHPNIVGELAPDVQAIESELGEHGRVLLRPSGTEPLIRVMVEATSDEDARRHAEHLAAIVRTRFGSGALT